MRHARARNKDNPEQTGLMKLLRTPTGQPTHYRTGARAIQRWCQGGWGAGGAGPGCDETGAGAGPTGTVVAAGELGLCFVGLILA